MRIPSLLVLGLLFGLCASCAESADPQPVVKKTISDSNSQAGKVSLKLSWAAQSSVSAFHIYYVDEKLKVREIDSLQSDSEAFSSPKIAIDDSNMESWPSKGGKACFYVVADNGGVLSDPSDKACITL
ncbi:MAG: hypothetical protein EOP07_07780 [Proteobacteria bacterium]|nr:MAG: hypothetical protein EOP07_07780 [Pseudomonadota bacterium]